MRDLPLRTLPLAFAGLFLLPIAACDDVDDSDDIALEMAQEDMEIACGRVCTFQDINSCLVDASEDDCVNVCIAEAERQTEQSCAEAGTAYYGCVTDNDLECDLEGDACATQRAAFTSCRI